MSVENFHEDVHFVIQRHINQEGPNYGGQRAIEELSAVDLVKVDRREVGLATVVYSIFLKGEKSDYWYPFRTLDVEVNLIPDEQRKAALRRVSPVRQ